MLADLVTGETGVADVLFLIAAVLAVVAAVLDPTVTVGARTIVVRIGWLAVALVAVGLMCL